MSPSSVTISRRRFLQGSLVAVSAVMVAGPRPSGAATPPPQPPTSLAAVLDVTPAGYAAGGDPRELLRLAASRNASPEDFARSIDTDAGTDLTMFVGALDLLWPYETLFGNQPEQKRRDAVAWATGDASERPDLGSYRTDVPIIQRPSVAKSEIQRDLAWGEVVRTILGLASSIASAATAPPSAPPAEAGPPTTAPETTTQEP